jgi:hypothetical protein
MPDGAFSVVREKKDTRGREYFGVHYRLVFGCLAPQELLPCSGLRLHTATW